MFEKRRAERNPCSMKGTIIVVDTYESVDVMAYNVSFSGVGATGDPFTPQMKGKRVVFVTSACVLNARVVRQDEKLDGSYDIGLEAVDFEEDVIGHIIDRISNIACLLK